MTGAVTIVLATGGAAVSATGVGVPEHPAIASSASRKMAGNSFCDLPAALPNGLCLAALRLLTAPN
jgi:hypothetical protein